MKESQFEILLSGLLCLVIITIPFSHPIFGSYAIGLLGVGALLHFAFRREWIRPPLFVLFLIAAYLVRVIWIAQAADTHKALKSLETEAALIVFPFLFCLFTLTDRSRRFVSMFYAAMGMIAIFYSFFQLVIFLRTSPYPPLEYILVHFDPKWFWETSRHFAAENMVNWEWGHYSFLNVIIIYGMHLLYFEENKSRGYKFFMWLYIVLTFLFVVMTGSRIGLIVYCLTLLGYGFIYLIPRLPKITTRAFIILALVALVPLLFALKWGYEKIDARRNSYVHVAAEAIKEKPLMGHGTGSAEAIMFKAHAEGKIDFPVNHPHNQYLTELVQFGLIGSIPFLAFLVSGLYFGMKRHNWALLFVLITLAVFMFVESPINSNKGVVPFCLLVCFLAATDKEKLLLEEQNRSKQ